MKKKHKKIAYILSQYPKISETFIAREIKFLRELGLDIVIFSLKKSNISEDNVYYAKLFKIIKANIFCLLKNPYLYMSLVVEILNGLICLEFKAVIKQLYIFFQSVYFSQIILNYEIDHIHAHFAWGAGASAWIISRLTKIPYSITVHAFDIFNNKMIDNLFQSKINNASFIVAISEYNKNFLVEKYRIPKEMIHIIHCGVENRFLNFSDVKFENKVPIIVSVGRLTAKKGFKYLIKSLKLLKENKVNYKGIIIGEGEDMENLLSLTDSLELNNEILFRGGLHNKEVISLLKMADIFVLPCVITKSGDMDGIPVVLMEAMALGVPVISTTISGIPELIEDGVSGFLVPEKNPSALAKAIAFLINDKSKRIQIGSFAKEKIQSGFLIEDNVNKLANLFSLSKYHRNE